MSILIVGDANVDVTVRWAGVEAGLHELGEEGDLLKRLMVEVQVGGHDIEHYFNRMPPKLDSFFRSLPHRTNFGGCAAIKSVAMAKISRDRVTLLSAVGKDKDGVMILNELKKEGVDTRLLKRRGRTYSTYNIFSENYKRLALSSWSPGFTQSDVTEELAERDYSKLLLAGAHRLPNTPLGYAELAERHGNAYVFTGSFYSYTTVRLRKKYKSDLSAGTLILNDSEALQIAKAIGKKAADPICAILKLPNECVFMHAPYYSAVKRGGDIIASPTYATPDDAIIERTGAGDVCEAAFLSFIDSVRGSSDRELRRALEAAAIAAHIRMTTGRIPSRAEVEKTKFILEPKGEAYLEF